MWVLRMYHVFDQFVSNCLALPYLLTLFESGQFVDPWMLQLSNEWRECSPALCLDDDDSRPWFPWMDECRFHEFAHIVPLKKINAAILWSDRYPFLSAHATHLYINPTHEQTLTCPLPSFTTIALSVKVLNLNITSSGRQLMSSLLTNVLWRKVEKLKITNQSCEGTSLALECFPQLTSLTLSQFVYVKDWSKGETLQRLIIPQDDDDFHHCPSVPPPSLTRVDIQWHWGFEGKWQQCVQKVLFDQLEHLEMYCSDLPPSPPNLFRRLTHWSCTLELFATAEEWNAWLASMPNLTHVTLKQERDFSPLVFPSSVVEYSLVRNS